MENYKHIALNIKAPEPELKELLILLAKIKWCGDVGASRSIKTHIDGDGSARFDIHAIIENKSVQLDELVKLDPNEIEKVGNGYDWSDLYIGE